MEIDIKKEVEEIRDLFQTPPEDIEYLYNRYDEYLMCNDENEGKVLYIIPPTRLTEFKGYGIEENRSDWFERDYYTEIAQNDDELVTCTKKITTLMHDLTSNYSVVDKKTIEFINLLSELFYVCREKLYGLLCPPHGLSEKEIEEQIFTTTICESEKEKYYVILLGRIFLLSGYLLYLFEKVQMSRYIEYDDVKDIIEEKIKKSLNPDYTKNEIKEEQLRTDKGILDLRERFDLIKDSYKFKYNPFDRIGYEDAYDDYHESLEWLNPYPSQPEQPSTQQDPPQPLPQPTKEYPCIYKVHTDNYTLLLQDLKTAEIITEQNNKHKWNFTQKLFTYFCYALRENKWLEVNRQNGIPWTKIALYYGVNNERLSTTFGEIIDKKTKKLRKISSLNSDKNKEVLDKVLEKYLNLDIL
jgi:hypothetical protein